MLEVRLTGVSALKQGEAKTFEFEREGERQEGFVMRHGEGFVAYRNWCPHWGVDLDMGEGKFYAAKVDRIYCKNHGALFQPSDGLCVAGPCAMERLEAFELSLEGDEMLIYVPLTVAERL